MWPRARVQISPAKKTKPETRRDMRTAPDNGDNKLWKNIERGYFFSPLLVIYKKIQVIDMHRNPSISMALKCHTTGLVNCYHTLTINIQNWTGHFFTVTLSDSVSDMTPSLRDCHLTVSQ